MNFENEFKNDIEYVNNALKSFLPKANVGQDDVVDAMEYSLMIGGKRLRPILCLRFAELFGAKRGDVMPLAASLEFLHTYSLIHDDLPCMDNDDFRRGQPSCHKKFGEDTALLAGDALLTHSFSNIAKANISDTQKIKAVSVLAEKAGVLGMIGGQVIDLKYEASSPTLQQILDVHKLKTGCLIESSCILGCIGASANEQQLNDAMNYAKNIGIAFQIQDDILDVIGDENKLGKHIGSDAENKKITYVSLVGLEQSSENVKKYTESAKDAIKQYDGSEYLLKLADFLTNREY